MTDSTKDSAAGEVRASVYKGANDTNSIMVALLNNGASHSERWEPTPLPPDRLNAMLEMSAHLRPSIESYVVNVHGRGHKLAPKIDLEGPDALRKVYDSLLIESLLASKKAGKDPTSVSPPSDDETQSELQRLQARAKIQKAAAESFFASCNPEGTFTDLRKRTGLDLEVTGNAYWEVLRDKQGKPSKLIRIRSALIRIGKGDSKEIAVTELKPLTDVVSVKVQTKKVFKRFVELDTTGKPVVWFKEFGDPRTMSSQTGKYYPNVEVMLATEKTSKPATEMFHFSIPATTPTSYGVPRWAGNVPGVLGSRELDETNLDYFMSNAVPALAILVSGGRFGKGVEERLKEFFTEDLRGRKASHKVITLEAEPARGTAGQPAPVPKIQFEPLRNAQINDALFQNYDEKNENKIRTGFRLPPSLVGRAKFSIEEMRYAEDQVFDPLRDDFDGIINKHFMPELGVTLWKFKSNAALVRDSDRVSKLVLDAVTSGVIVPNEARRILGELIQEELQPFDTIWANQPLPLTMAVLGVKAGPAEAVREQGRQAGDTSPMERVLEELGLSGEDPDSAKNKLISAIIGEDDEE